MRSWEGVRGVRGVVKLKWPRGQLGVSDSRDGAQYQSELRGVSETCGPSTETPSIGAGKKCIRIGERTGKRVQKVRKLMMGNNVGADGEEKVECARNERRAFGARRLERDLGPASWHFAGALPHASRASSFFRARPLRSGLIDDHSRQQGGTAPRSTLRALASYTCRRSVPGGMIKSHSCL